MTVIELVAHKMPGQSYPARQASKGLPADHACGPANSSRDIESGALVELVSTAYTTMAICYQRSMF